ncbi:MAG: signal recognition particle protein [Chloroflexota bacterium]|nr:signal recognition particle protein [Chloroflexota bacterium]
MFDNLSERLVGIFNNLSNRGRLTEKDIDEALTQVRRSLLEADVNFRVARDFVAKVKERAQGSDILQSLTPGQQVVKVVHEELTQILTSGDHNLRPASQLPSTLMLVGLQGSGKTTTAAKLALHMRKQGHTVLLVAADLKRPAAIAQLEALGKQLDVPVYSEKPDTSSPVQVAKAGVKKGAELGCTWVIIDTGGRLQIDDELMAELADISTAVKPHEILFVLDSMTGQDAVNAAKEFHDRVSLSGLIMSKLDGDARGGAALSATQVTGVPIKFVGVSERPDGLEAFHPDRVASRILGMGDVLTLIEKAQQTIDETQIKDVEKKLRQATFDLDDFLQQIQNVKQMGSISQIMDMLPGMGQMGKNMPANVDDSQMQKMEAMIQSMTAEERHHPELINGSRRRRIALGSGTTAQEINLLLNQFKQTQKIMKRFAKTKNPRALMNMFK